MRRTRSLDPYSATTRRLCSATPTQASQPHCSAGAQTRPAACSVPASSQAQHSPLAATRRMAQPSKDHCLDNRTHFLATSAAMEVAYSQRRTRTMRIKKRKRSISRMKRKTRRTMRRRSSTGIRSRRAKFLWTMRRPIVRFRRFTR